MPVEPTSFSAEPAADGILLQWVTQSEIDNLRLKLPAARCAGPIYYIFRVLKASGGPSKVKKSNSLVPLCGESSICREETSDIRSLTPRPATRDQSIICLLVEGKPRGMRSLTDSYWNGRQPAGRYNLSWHGRDDSGARMASGSYIIILKTAEEMQKQKVVLSH